MAASEKADIPECARSGRSQVELCLVRQFGLNLENIPTERPIYFGIKNFCCYVASYVSVAPVLFGRKIYEYIRLLTNC